MRAARFLIISYQRQNGISRSRNCAMGSNSARPFNSARLNARSGGGKRIIRASTAALSLLYRQPSSGDRVRLTIRGQAAVTKHRPPGCSNGATRFLCSAVFSLFPPDRKKEPQSITHLHFDRRPECADRQKIINVNNGEALARRSYARAKYAKSAAATRLPGGSAHSLSFLRV